MPIAASPLWHRARRTGEDCGHAALSGPMTSSDRERPVGRVGGMDALTITFVTACTALIAGVAGPLVSVFVARQQIRASVISNNRERWVETLRDAVAEYVALALSVSLAKQATGEGHSPGMGVNGALLQTAERIVLVKNKIMLMTNPNESTHAALCEAVEVIYLALASNQPLNLTKMRADAETVTRAGRAVLKAEWARVKHGD